MSTLTLAARRAASRRPGLFSRLMGMDSAFRQRRALSELDATRLRDIGLTRDDVAGEMSRPLWDAPATWRR